jgi:hypothetical protein
MKSTEAKKDKPPRKVLESYYDLNKIDNVPNEINYKKIPYRKKSNYNVTIMNDDLDSEINITKDKLIFDNETKDLLVKLYSNNNISLEQREVISKSILHGKIEISNIKKQKHQPFILHKDYEKDRVAKLTTNRHQLQKSSFLNITSQSVDIPILDSIALHEQRIKFFRLNTGGEGIHPPSASGISNTTNIMPSSPLGMVDGFTSHDIQEDSRSPLPLDIITDDYNNTNNNNNGRHINSSSYSSEIISNNTNNMATTNMKINKSGRNKTIVIDDSTNLRQIQLQLLNEHKKKLNENSKLKFEQKKQDALYLKKQQDDLFEKKIQIKKKLNEFRKKLYEYLLERKDPMMGTIMRCVDESMVYHFMHTYQGFTMSIEAILAILGNSLGTSIVNPEIPSETIMGDDELAIIHYNQLLHERGGGGGGGGGGGPKLPKLFIFDDSRGTTPVLGRTRRLLSRTASTNATTISANTSTRLSRNNNNSNTINNNKGSDRNNLMTNPSHHKYFHHDHEKEDVSRSSNKSRYDDEYIASLHRINGPINEPVQGIHTLVDRTNARPSSPTIKTLGSGFRYSYKSNDSAAIEAPYVDNLPNRPISPIVMQLSSVLHNPQHLVVFGSENLRNVAKEMGFEYNVYKGLQEDPPIDTVGMMLDQHAIHAVRDQLLEEQFLPSVQPEKVLSDIHIDQLGTHQKKFESIFKDINKAKNMKKNALIDGNLSLLTGNRNLDQQHQQLSGQQYQSSIVFDDSFMKSHSQNEDDYDELHRGTTMNSIIASSLLRKSTSVDTHDSRNHDNDDNNNPDVDNNDNNNHHVDNNDDNNNHDVDDNNNANNNDSINHDVDNNDVNNHDIDNNHDNNNHDVDSNNQDVNNYNHDYDNGGTIIVKPFISSSSMKLINYTSNAGLLNLMADPNSPASKQYYKGE